MNYLIDVPVLLVFFNRPDTFKKVFEVVKKAKPSTLLLYQDGPRNEKDLEKIQECRRIAEDIDWNCKVYKKYQEKNFGCDPSGYLADTWAFSLVDKCIILEDDVLPTVSFFSFCKKMLDKYENDERIMLITGINFDEISTDVDSDYFFTSCTDTWGWATWRRVVEKWDSSYSALYDNKTRRMLQNYIKEKNMVNNWLDVFEGHHKSNIEHFETILILNQMLNNGLTIVPKKNMIKNIGLTEGATHFSNNINLLPYYFRKVFLMNQYDVQDEMKEPNYVIDNVSYIKRNYAVKGNNHPIKKRFAYFLICLKLLCTFKFKELIKLLKR